ncbi:helix-turn-helix domain-containing protein [Amycolatopsis sp. NPDC003676]
MSVATDLKEFLVSRRAKVTPDQVGLPWSGRRRVPGLRREEVATLAGVSPDYYVQIERGRAGDISDEVLYAISRALLLNDVETAHLFGLARARPRTGAQRAPDRVPDGVLLMLDRTPDLPMLVQNGRLDLVAANDLGRALYSDVYDRAPGTPNLARYVFFDDRSAEFFPDWGLIADYAVCLLRAEAGRAPYHRKLTELIGELATRSDEFKTRWARHDVRTHDRGEKQFRHPVVGDLTLRYEGFAIPGADGLSLYSYLAPPGDHAAHDALLLLASWAKTHAEPAADPSVSPPRTP